MATELIKAFFGIHAIHLPCQFLIQGDSKPHSDGRYRAACVVLVSSDTPILSQQAMDMNAPHELIVGDLVIRPHGKWAGRNYIGSGMTALATSEAMFPTGWDVQTLDNGFNARLEKARKSMNLEE